MAYQSDYVRVLSEKLKALGVSDYGFAKSGAPDGCPCPDLPYAVSIVVKLSDAVVDQITDKPTFSYFHHYRTVNAYIDNIILQTGMLIESLGFRYFPIAASQSVPDAGSYAGLLSHKAVARTAGLGSIGKNALFLSKKFGARVRLGTLLTNMPLPLADAEDNIDLCGDCDLCVRTCPALALTGRVWHEGMARSDIIDAGACSRYMKETFQSIGRGAVCGICMKICKYQGEGSK